MTTDGKFRDERERALDDIRKAVNGKIQELVNWARDFMKGKDQLTLPDHLKIQETFRWPAALLHAASQLKDDKPLKEIFSRVSPRYQADDLRQVLGLSDDLTRSPAAKTDGRLSAFEDVLKILDVAERDLDLHPRPLPRETMEFWLKRHPIGPHHLELAYRENQRHFTKESLQEMRRFIVDLKNKPPKPPAPKFPSP